MGVFSFFGGHYTTFVQYYWLLVHHLWQANHTKYHHAIIIIPYRHTYNYVLGAVVRIVRIMLMHLSLLVPRVSIIGTIWIHMEKMNAASSVIKQLDTSDLTESQQLSRM